MVPLELPPDGVCSPPLVCCTTEALLIAVSKGSVKHSVVATECFAMLSTRLWHILLSSSKMEVSVLHVSCWGEVELLSAAHTVPSGDQ